MSECCYCIHCQNVIVAVDEERDEIYEEGVCEFDEKFIDEIDQTKDCEDFEKEE